MSDRESWLDNIYSNAMSARKYGAVHSATPSHMGFGETTFKQGRMPQQNRYQPANGGTRQRWQGGDFINPNTRSVAGKVAGAFENLAGGLKQAHEDKLAAASAPPPPAPAPVLPTTPLSPPSPTAKPYTGKPTTPPPPPTSPLPPPAPGIMPAGSPGVSPTGVPSGTPAFPAPGTASPPPMTPKPLDPRRQEIADTFKAVREERMGSTTPTFPKPATGGGTPSAPSTFGTPSAMPSPSAPATGGSSSTPSFESLRDSWNPTFTAGEGNLPSASALSGKSRAQKRSFGPSRIGQFGQNLIDKNLSPYT